ncbi:MAG: Amuc_1099 family pilus-like system protein [Verrucomicrobiales bacterium]
MSWVSENYHKLVFGAGLLAAAGLGYSAWSSSAELKESFELQSRPKNTDTAVSGMGQAEGIIKSVKSSTTLKKASLGDRPVDLFTSVGLVVRKGATDKALDLEKEAPIHPPIENQWWIDHGIDPGWGDSPQRDEDSDGFSNLEEYQAKTSPTNPAEHPLLIDKLRVASVESYSFRPLLSSILGDGKYQFRFEDSDRRENRMSAGNTASIGDIFFENEPAKGRFKLLKVETRQEESSTGTIDREYATLEDQKANKKGKTYDIPYRLSSREKAEGHSVFNDYTVIFTLEAVGQEGKEFKVEENMTFALPAEAKEKGYKLVEVKADAKGKATAVVVAYQDGGETKQKELAVPAN